MIVIFDCRYYLYYLYVIHFMLKTYRHENKYREDFYRYLLESNIVI